MQEHRVQNGKSGQLHRPGKEVHRASGLVWGQLARVRLRGLPREQVSCSLSPQHPPAVKPVVQLQETQPCTALLQTQPQLLDIASTVIHCTVAPVPCAVETGQNRKLPSPESIW